MLHADWTKFYESSSDIKNDIRVKLPYKEFRGWIESDTDTLFIEPSKGKMGVDGYFIYCWNQPNARQILAEIIGLPVYKE